MDVLFSPTYQFVWVIALGAALFIPVRQLIWTLQVRREESRQRHPLDEPRRYALRRRASVTAALLVFVFAWIYVNVLFGKLYGPP